MATTLTPAATLPGPKARGLAGNLREFAAGRLAALDRWKAEYGDVVGLRFGHRRMMLLSDPALIEQVLVEHPRRTIKHFVLRRTRRTLGSGLLTSEGDLWRRQRRLAQPGFARERLAGYAEVMVDFTGRMLDGWADGQPLDAHRAMMRLTLEVVARCLFGADVARDSAEAGLAMETVLRRFTATLGRLLPVPDWVPLPGNIRLNRAIHRLEGIIYGIIADRRASGVDRGDLLSILLRAVDAEGDGGRMTDWQLRDEVMTLFMAGHETTANTLAWSWYRLARDPGAEAALHAEVDAVLGDRPPTLADVPRLPFAEAVVSESLRLDPAVWLIGREATEPLALGGYRVPVGTTLYMSQWVVHRDGRWFDDPLGFRPARWLDGLARRLPRFAYFPFGGGPRVCIGQGFAMTEAVLILATVARRFRLEAASGAEVRPVPTMTLRPDGGVPVVLRRRR